MNVIELPQGGCVRVDRMYAVNPLDEEPAYTCAGVNVKGLPWRVIVLVGDMSLVAGPFGSRELRDSWVAAAVASVKAEKA